RGAICATVRPLTFCPLPSMTPPEHRQAAEDDRPVFESYQNDPLTSHETQTGLFLAVDGGCAPSPNGPVEWRDGAWDYRSSPPGWPFGEETTTIHYRPP